MNLLISLYDRTGNWSRPYLEAGWFVLRIDQQAKPYQDENRITRNIDILDWDYKYDYSNILFASMHHAELNVIILAAQPCDRYALCGNKHKAVNLFNGEFDEAQKLVAKTKEIIDYFNPFAWALENPKTDIHKKNTWIGQRPKYVFNPCDFAGYSPNPDDDRYNKETWLFGKFNDPVKKRLEPFTKESPIWRDHGGKSLETKNARSITPLGFSYAFYEANRLTPTLVPGGMK